MASVWVARLQGKHGFEKLVAIKTILPMFAEDIRFQHMFLDEARIASRIEHMHVAQILDLGEEHDVLYLVMEWIDGDALSKLKRACDRNGIRIPPGILLRVLADTCGGLHAAHELAGADGASLGVVHRDVSPQNILVNTRGVAKLIDFGIAKARDRIAGDTNAGLLKGKIQYMAPEQALGRVVDRRADVWAIGSILYALLAGRPPYDGENQLETLYLLTSGKPPDPLPETVPAAVRDVVSHALVHDPEKRYATAAEMQTALEKAMVDAMIVTTVADVAAFAAKQLAGRTEKRKQAIELALRAAADRLRMQALLQAPSNDSSTGVISGLPNVPQGTTLTPISQVSAAGDDRGSATRAVPPPRLVNPPAFASAAATAGAPSGETLSETSSATLGSAAVESPYGAAGAPPQRRSALLVIGGAASVFAIISLLIGGGVVLFRSTAPRGAAAPTNAPMNAVAAVSSPPVSAARATQVEEMGTAAEPDAATTTRASAVAASASASASAVASASAPASSVARGGPATATGVGTTAATTKPATPSGAKPVSPKAVDDGF